MERWNRSRGLIIKNADMPHGSGVIVVVDGTCCRPTYPDHDYGIRLGDTPNGLGIVGAGVGYRWARTASAAARSPSTVNVMGAGASLPKYWTCPSISTVPSITSIGTSGQEKKKDRNQHDEWKQQTPATPGTGYTQ